MNVINTVLTLVLILPLLEHGCDFLDQQIANRSPNKHSRDSWQCRTFIRRNFLHNYCRCKSQKHRTYHRHIFFRVCKVREEETNSSCTLFQCKQWQVGGQAVLHSECLKGAAHLSSPVLILELHIVCCT